jgi:hypothetical protein
MEEVATQTAQTPQTEQTNTTVDVPTVFSEPPSWEDLTALMAKDNDNNAEPIEFVTFELPDGTKFQFPEKISATLKTAKNLMDDCSGDHGLVVPLSELKDEGFYQYKYVPLAFTLLYVNSRDPVPQYIPIDETKKYPLEVEIYKYSAYDLMAACHIIHYLEPDTIFMTAVVRYMTNKDIRGKSVEELCKNYGVDPSTLPIGGNDLEETTEPTPETTPEAPTPVTTPATATPVTGVSGEVGKDKEEETTEIEEVD